jgi:hypothetical protein
VDVPFLIRHRLEELGLEQRDLACAAPVTEIQAADPRTTLSRLLRTSSERLRATPIVSATRALRPASPGLMRAELP